MERGSPKKGFTAGNVLENQQSKEMRSVFMESCFMLKTTITVFQFDDV